MSAAKGPVLIELQDEPEQGPQNAPPPPDLTESSAIRQLAVTKRPAGRLARWFWRLLAAILVFAFSLWAWGLVTSTVAANPVLGYAVTVVLGAFVLVSLLIILREFAAIARLKKLDGLREEAEHALETDDLAAA
ncbi:MAG: TIGR01620 family protein, partial [Paracoccaceae bacterium]|nr:TIGR01620 family protein [Paracoccaceae bacterium]